MSLEKLGSLRIRLMALVLLALAPAVGLVLFSSFERRAELSREFHEDAKNFAVMAAANGGGLVEGAKTLLAALAGMSEVQGLWREGSQRLFSNLLAHSPAYLNIGLVLPSGDLVSSGLPLPAAVNLGEREWFARAVRTGEFAVSGYVIGRVSGRPVIVMAQPVKDAAGAIRAVVFASVSLDWFHAQFDAVKLPEGATVSLINREGVIMARRPDVEGLLGRPIPRASDIMPEVLAGRLDFNEDWGIDGVRRLFTFAPVAKDPGNEIFMRVGVPLSLAAAQVEWALWRDLGLVAAAALAILAGTHFFSEAFILRRTRKLVEAAGRLAAGGYPEESGLSEGSGELAALGRAFESMAGILREKIRFTQTLIDSIPTPVFYKDIAGVYIGCNEQFGKDVASGAEVVGKTVFEIFGPEHAAGYHRKDRELYETLGPQIYESEMVFRDGLARAVVVYKAVCRDAEGRPNGLVGVITDISERKNLEKRLTRAKEAAEAANAVKTRFLATVSHEIRTPMNSIMGMTELALHGALSPLQREHLETVDQSAKHLLLLIEDILDFAKIEAGELKLEHSDFDPRQVIEDALRPLRVQAKDKGVELALEIDSGLPCCLAGDPARLRQILINLAGNAIKFTGRGKVTLHAGLADPADPADPAGPDAGKPTVVFRIADTGVGIPQDKLRLIFEPFQQADGTVGRRYGGSGLGLAISRELAGLMGGTIQVESVPGQGSVFVLTAAFELGDPARIAPATVEYGRLGASSDCCLRVLVVDDNEINLKVCMALLARLGHVSLAAESGGQALELLGRDDFDVVLMDVEMPGMDGFEAVGRIRRGEAGEGAARVPIVALTAHALEGYREKCLQAGMNGFITKPVSLTSLTAGLAFLTAGDPGQGGRRG